MNKITQQIDSMHPISRNVIKYGFFAFLFIIIGCLVISILNKYSFGNIYNISKTSKELFQSSFSVLGITLIGGLIMDYLSKRQ